LSGFVQKRSVYPGTSLAYSSNVTAGNLLVVWLVWTSGTLTGVSGSLNGAFTVSSTSGTGITKCAIAYKFNCSGGAETISAAGAPTDLGFTIYEFSGIQTSSDPLDGSIASTTIASSTTTPTSASFSNSVTGLIFVGIGDEGTTQSTTTAGSGYTLGEFQGGHDHADEYALTVAAGSHTASFTLGTACSGSPDCVIVVACFKDAGVVTGGQWVGSGTRRAPGQKGPFDQRGFLASPFRQYDFTPSVVPSVATFIYRMRDLDGLSGQGATMKNPLE
jgi:hypothetical protein